MMRWALIAALVVSVLVPTVALQSGSAGTNVPGRAKPQLLAFRGGFGGFHFGGSRVGRRGFGGFGFGRRRSSRGLLHRIARALAFAYLFHLFFSHGGFSILLWLVVIGLIVHLVRRRRRRYSY